jgi:hypothetical protein
VVVVVDGGCTPGGDVEGRGGKSEPVQKWEWEEEKVQQGANGGGSTGAPCWHTMHPDPPDRVRAQTGMAPAPTQKAALLILHTPTTRRTSCCSQPARHAHFAHVFVLILLAAARATSRRLKHANWAIFQLFTAEDAHGKFYFSWVGVSRVSRPGGHGRPLHASRPLGFGVLSSQTFPAMQHLVIGAPALGAGCN